MSGNRSPYSSIRSARGREAQGRDAGVVSRCWANLLDLGVAWVITFIVLALWGGFRYIVFGDPLQFPRPTVALSLGLYWAILILYLTEGWASGRTIGKRVVGLRVEGVDGTVKMRRWFLRALVSVAVWVVFMVTVATSRDNRGWHDRVFGTRVVYDWTRR